MIIPVALRGDFKASQLRAFARKTKVGPQARRLLALAAIYDGATRTEAAKIGGVTLQIIRDWVMRVNARGAAGPAIHGVVRWRLIDLVQWIYEKFLITVAKQTLSRELRAMGYRKLSARPRHHAQAEGAIEDFKKTSQRAWTRSRAQRRSAATR